MKKTPSGVKTAPYTAELTFSKRTGVGQTPLEALENLVESPFVFKFKDVLTLSYKGKTAEQLLFVLQLRRLFNNAMYRQILAKYLPSRLK